MFEQKITKLKEDYVRFCKSKKLAGSTIDVYWGSVSHFLTHYTIYDVGRLSWEKVADYILNYDNSKTINQKRYAIELFYKVCLNQPNKLRKMPHAKVPKIIPQTLSPQECENLFSTIKNTKHKAIIEISYYCALRISEVINIRIRHIDKHTNRLFIEQSKGAKDRIVPIPEGTIDLLREYFKKYFDLKKYNKNDYLFQGESKSHEQYSDSSIRSILKRAIIEANINKKIKFHSLRHSRATHWKNANLDIRDIADLLGHSSTKTTEIYLHTGIDDLQDRVVEAELKIKSKINVIK